MSKPSSNPCEEVTLWANTLSHFSFPYDETKIPNNGIYILFEIGELGHGKSRIVRIGTHTGDNQLKSRLRQHFLASNKDRSIFRKNIGRCLLNKAHDPYLALWELDLTTRVAKDLHGALIDTGKQKEIEKKISDHMRENFFFAVIQVDNKEERLALESKLISTISLCNECGPSKQWIGNYSPKEKIKRSGLWLVNELYKDTLSQVDIDFLKNL